MKWDWIQEKAKTKGVLIFAMDQSQTAPLTEPGPWGSSFDGYCIGLAANWVSLAYQGSDFPTSGNVCDNPPWQSTMAQNLSDAIHSSDWTDCWRVSTDPFHCRLSKGLHALRHDKPSADFLWSIMSKAYGCYGVTLVRDGGAHAIALRHGHDNRYHLFDSNYYHVAMKGVDTFKQFLDGYLSDTGYRKKYNKKTGIIGIVPPISA